MKVKLKKGKGKHHRFTFGKAYLVIGIEADDYRIINDDGEPYVYEPAWFEIVDPTWEMSSDD